MKFLAVLYFTGVTLETNKQSEWDMGGSHFARYEVEVNNNMDSDANILVGFDTKIIGEVLNVTLGVDEQLNLPQIIRVKKNSSVGLGFVISGRDEPNLFINSVSY
ncbi:hypothetical protein ACTFIZ_007076 [Dictyostelium cf. discoideum]